VVVVIGGAHSNNTHELVKTCAQFCPRVHHIQTADDLRPDWFHANNIVGITAGTSTPDPVIAAVENGIQFFAAARRTYSKTLSR
jgi:4-hydroxy-3-methylbut-2-enyl diphosphate reductase